MVISPVIQNGGQNGIDGGENCSCATFILQYLLRAPMPNSREIST